MLRSCSVYYANARDIRFDVPAPAAMLAAASRGEYQLVAYLDARDAEHVYDRLQNGVPGRSPEGWTADLNPTERYAGQSDECRRSMSVGDLIVWADGSVEVCHPIGFQRFHGGRCESMLRRRLQLPNEPEAEMPGIQIVVLEKHLTRAIELMRELIDGTALREVERTRLQDFVETVEGTI